MSAIFGCDTAIFETCPHGNIPLTSVPGKVNYCCSAGGSTRCLYAPPNVILFCGVAMSHIFTANLSHSSDAWIGVGLIGVYFVWMLYMALTRISKGEHLHH
jgi:glycosylphosphatidylinositol transamidase (GPIT) subunit GPI8